MDRKDNLFRGTKQCIVSSVHTKPSRIPNRRTSSD